VKGTKFETLRLAGNPVELARKYRDDGADELMFLDISASEEKRKTRVNLARRVARELDIPFTIGGGISSVEDTRSVLTNGADKVSINTAAVNDPELISKLADVFGSQCVVVSIDSKRGPRADSGYTVCTYGGKKDESLDAVEWSKRVEALGAGEILLTSIDRDGTELGYDVELTREITSHVTIPVIASGGCGKLADFEEILSGPNSASAALAASTFHYGKLSVGQVKRRLRSRGVTVRI
jgi:imidazole glycerol-phosphate synthase subunit HisF